MTGEPPRGREIGSRSRRIWLVAIGDALAIVAFLALGLTRHGIDPLLFPRHTVLTALPFVSAWFLLAPIAGLYRLRTLRSGPSTLVRTTAAWTGVSLLGSAVRSTPFLPGGAPPEFLLVVIVFGAGVLLPWRLAVTLAEHVRHNHQGETDEIGRA